MIKGTFKKFEPLEGDEVTITIKAKQSELPAILDLYRKEITIVPQQEGIPEQRTDILKSIRDNAERMAAMINSELYDSPSLPTDEVGGD